MKSFNSLYKPILIIVVCLHLNVVKGTPISPVVVTVEPCPTNPMCLLVNMKNTGDISVDVAYSVMPWKYKPSIILALVNPRTRNILKQNDYFQLESLPWGRIPLEPQKELYGTFDLSKSNWSSNLLEVLRNEDVLVFWNYEFRIILWDSESGARMQKFQRQGGWCIIGNHQSGETNSSNGK